MTSSRARDPALRLRLLLPHLKLGGGETVMLDVAEGLAQRFSVEVGALAVGGLAGPLSTDRSVTSAPDLAAEIRARFGSLEILDERWKLAPFLEGCDALLWYGVVSQVPRTLARLRRRPASVRVVHTDRALDGEGFQQRWGDQIDATVCVSPVVARRVPGAVFIPNTCSESFLQGAALPGHPRPGRCTLGFLGRLAPLKNVPWLVEHLAEIEGCDLLIQALDTEAQTVAQLRRRAAELGLLGKPGPEARVRFLPPSRDVGTLLRSVDALVLLSRHEGFPRVVIEAGMLHVPVIATRVGALPELFAKEILFVDSREGAPDLDSLTAAVDAVEASRGEALRRRVESLCEPGAVVRRYEEVIREAIRRRRVPGET